MLPAGSRSRHHRTVFRQIMGRHLDQWLAANFSSAINQMSALGVKRTSITGPVMSAFDPKRTLDEPAARLAAGYFGASGLTRLVDHPNEGQLAILMCVVDAIADDENVGSVKPTKSGSIATSRRLGLSIAHR